jgi:hypothetical protein
MPASTPVPGFGSKVEGCVAVSDAGPMLTPAATDLEAQRAVQAARQVFARTLACWAGDLLDLRSRGLHQATWTGCRGRRRLRRAA